MVQVLAAEAHVAEGAVTRLDADGDAAHGGECPGESQPAHQRRPLALVQIITKHPIQSRQETSHPSTLRLLRLIGESLPVGPRPPARAALVPLARPAPPRGRGAPQSPKHNATL